MCRLIAKTTEISSLSANTIQTIPDRGPFKIETRDLVLEENGSTEGSTPFANELVHLSQSRLVCLGQLIIRALCIRTLLFNEDFAACSNGNEGPFSNHLRPSDAMTSKVPLIAPRKNSSGIPEGCLASLRHGRFANKQIVIDEVKIAMEGMFIWMQNYFQNPIYNYAISGIAICLGKYAATGCENDDNFLLDSISARCRQAFVSNLQNSRSFVSKCAEEIVDVNASTQPTSVYEKTAQSIPTDETCFCQGKSSQKSECDGTVFVYFGSCQGSNLSSNPPIPLKETANIRSTRNNITLPRDISRLTSGGHTAVGRYLSVFQRGGVAQRCRIIWVKPIMSRTPRTPSKLNARNSFTTHNHTRDQLHHS